MIDGRLAHIASVGVANRNSRTAVTKSTVFRIASMTKSFTALAILKLRDEGRLSLEDPVSKWIPEFASMEMPTRDAPPIRVRHLLTHSAGFPEDNPWGDQQLGASEEDLTRWLKLGIPFSSEPGTQYEYSNYGFGLLGRIVSKASGEPYDQYLQKQILAPLNMSASTLESSQVRSSDRAIGYRRQPDGSYLEEPPLPHGAFGSMGGLLTTANDLGRYVAFHLSAWPARDEAESGPVRRSSVREMNDLWRTSNLTVSRPNGKLQAEGRGYGYGLRISTDCRFEHVVGHGGGLPGFGSYMAWLPDYGVGIFAMANLTYVGPAQPINEAWDALLKDWRSTEASSSYVSPVDTNARSHFQVVEIVGSRGGEEDGCDESLSGCPSSTKTGADSAAQNRSWRVHCCFACYTRKLAARAVQLDLRERNCRGLLHARSDQTARGAVLVLSEARSKYRTAKCSHRSANRKYLL